MKNKEELLIMKGVRVAMGATEILHGIDLTVRRGETVVLMGANGAGKSTLAGAVMGDSRMEVLDGEIWFESERIERMKTEQRARKGIMLTMQMPIEIPGVSTAAMLRTALEERKGERVKMDLIKQELVVTSRKLSLDRFMMERELNVGFSGGEKKKNEALQLLVLKPKLAILDELDSGLDVDAAETVSKAIRELQKEIGMSLVVISHNLRILKKLKVDKVIVMDGGKIVEEGGRELLKKMEEKGFSEFGEKK